jgi:uncharacterized protein
MNSANEISADNDSASGRGQNHVISRNSSSPAGSHSNNELLNLLEETGELPDISDENKLLIFPVDPYLIFSCWTIKKSDVEMIARKIGRKYRRLDLALRVFDITGVTFDGYNANSCFDIRVDPGDGSCYVSLCQAGRRYIADLGFNNEYGIFYPVCRSNITDTPPGPLAGIGPGHQPSEISGFNLPEKIDTAFTPGISSHPSS